jgi:hypothetical protein
MKLLRRTSFVSAKSQGAALLITLTLLVLMTIIVVAFFAGVSTDRLSVVSSETLVKQRLLVDNAVAHATSILAENIPSPNYNPVDPAENPSFTNWWVNPGRLTTQRNTEAPQVVNLYSTPVQGQSAGVVNLNQRLFDEAGEAFYPVEPSGAELNVSWVEVLQNPLLPRQSNRSLPNYNPVVGRYAFWMDPETNKINFNTALGIATQSPAMTTTGPATHDSRTGSFWPIGNVTAGRLTKQWPEWNPWWVQEKPFSLGLPSTVGFSGLANSNQLNAPQIFWNHAFRLWNRMDSGSSGIEPFDAARYQPLLTPRSVKSLVADSANADAFWNENRFMVTSRSWSPEFNVFGKPRFMHYFARRGPRDWSKKQVEYQMPVREEMLPFIASRSGYKASTAASGAGFVGFPGTGTESNAWMVRYYQAYQRALGAYLQYPWPGIGTSFLDKWQQGGFTTADALAEIDQFAWNTQFAAAGTFEGINPDYQGNNNVRAKPGQGRDYEVLGGDIYKDFDFWGTPTTLMRNALPKGMYSNRGIGPAAPLPFLNEVGLQVTPRQQSATELNTLHLEFCLRTEFFVPTGHAFGTWKMDIPNYRVSYLEYTVQKNGGAEIPIVARLNQGNVNATPAEMEAGVTNKLRSDTLNSHYFVFTNATSGHNVQYALGAGQVAEVRTLQSPNYVEGWNRDPEGNSAVYFAHQNNLSPGTISNLLAFQAGDNVRISNIRLRLVFCNTWSSANPFYYRVIPNRGRPGVETPGLTPATTIEEALITLPDVVMSDIQPSEASAVNSVEISDPRLYGSGTAWMPSSDPSGNSLGALNPEFLAAADTSKLAWHNGTPESDNWYPQPVNYPFVSTGFLFNLPTGMQRGVPWSTIDLSETLTTAAGMPPDYLLLDLFAMSTDYSQMHATNGKINLNTRVYPEAFGQNLDRGQRILASAVQGIQVNGTPINAEAFAQWLVNNEPASGYAFRGQFMEAPQLDMGQTTEYAKQLLRSRISDLFTTQSNTYTIHGVIETVSDMNGTLTPISRRPFQAIVEREIFPGRDGIKGNGHVDPDGNWSRIGDARTIGGGDLGNARLASPGDPLDVIDGPDLVTLPMPGDSTRNETSPSTLLEDSYNPALPYFRYRTLSMNYINE